MLLPARADDILRRNRGFLCPGLTRGLGSGLLTVLLVVVSLAVTAADMSPPARLIASTDAEWSQFRGPRRDGVCDERGLLSAWPEGGPKPVWSATNLGRGYSSPVIAGGRLFITGDVGDELHVFAMDLQGDPLWHKTNGASWKGPYPGARATVTYSAGRIYHENAHGRLACFDAETGRELWALRLLDRFAGKNTTWGLSESVLVDDRSVYATAGGREALFVALDKATGGLRWKSRPLFDTEGDGGPESASYASPVLVQFGGRRLLIGCSLRHLVCVDADSGEFQWTRRMPTTHSVLAMMPVLVGDAVFMTGPDGKGGRLLRLLPPARPDEAVGVKEVWSTVLDSLQGGVVLVDGRLYGSFYRGPNGWAALDAKTGEVLYNAPDFAKGSVLAADDRLYALCEDGLMLLLQSGEESFHVQGRFRLVEAKVRDAWAHPVIHQGRLYLRYHETLLCYDIKAVPAENSISR